MDLKTLTDEELAQHRIDVLTEQERRANLAEIPQQVAQLAQTFTAGGGDRAVLTAAIDGE
ncbi:hypothetical protein F8O06_02660 [Pseudoclavibacter sp. CFCC 14310]|uniref:hypothetical protein n=1 Tax=Pseudoclavibacter sp. CFCC 14310 TaxID=2615180 RepID=UPI0013013BBB|nr:hypothetical protein [Pseudoclavibacter sp. CFCC 14310]KAB1647458.1 hypothetical protein F8O06_02660 [Pseudoclavibacter sp. CFCC 14310]